MEWLNVATLRFGDKKFPRGTTGVENLMMENSGGTNEKVGGAYVFPLLKSWDHRRINFVQYV